MNIVLAFLVAAFLSRGREGAAIPMPPAALTSKVLGPPVVVSARESAVQQLEREGLYLGEAAKRGYISGVPGPEAAYVSYPTTGYTPVELKPGEVYVGAGKIKTVEELEMYGPALRD